MNTLHVVNNLQFCSRR